MAKPYRPGAPRSAVSTPRSPAASVGSARVSRSGFEPPLYWECPGCGFLSDDPRVGAGDKACPGCSLDDTERRQFPPERLRRLHVRINRYHADGDYEIVVILGATFLESLLEDILARIMEAHGADVKLRELVLDTQRSIGQRIGKLFPTLTGQQFEDAVAEAGFAEFSRRWRRLRTERNAFIHDSTFEGPREELTLETADEAMVLLDQAYKVFVLINNRFVADGHHRSHS